MYKLSVSLAHCAGTFEGVFYPNMEKLLPEVSLAITDALVYGHDVFDKHCEGDRTDNQDDKNSGVNAVQNDQNDVEFECVVVSC